MCICAVQQCSNLTPGESARSVFVACSAHFTFHISHFNALPLPLACMSKVQQQSTRLSGLHTSLSFLIAARQPAGGLSGSAGVLGPVADTITRRRAWALASRCTLWWQPNGACPRQGRDLSGLADVPRPASDVHACRSRAHSARSHDRGWIKPTSARGR